MAFPAFACPCVVALSLAALARGAGTEDTMDPSAAEVFTALEQRLLASETVWVEAHLVATGAFQADVRQTLELYGDNAGILAIDGTFGTAVVTKRLESDGAELKLRLGAVGSASAETTADRRVAELTDEAGEPEELGLSLGPEFQKAILIGATRMGLLHNVAILTQNGAPDHQNGGVDTWVITNGFRWAGELQEGERLLRAVEFELEVAGTPSGSATLWLDAESWLPVKRTQTVNFPSGRMDVVETYESLVVTP